MPAPIVTRNPLGLHHEGMTPHPSADQARIQATVPGQASWAVPGCDRTCRECEFWLCKASRPARNAIGQLMPQFCGEAKRSFKSRKIAKVPHDAIACRLFKPRRDPPEAVPR